jgi:hypothetical protein
VNLNEAILPSIAAPQHDYIIGNQDKVVTQVQFMFLSDDEYMIIDALHMEFYVFIPFMNLKLFYKKIYIFATLRDEMSKRKI